MEKLKKVIRNFFQRNMKILLFMGCALILFMIFAYITMLLFVNQHDQIETFLETNELSRDLYPVVFSSFAFFLAGAVFVGLLTIFIVKLFFPNTRAFSQLFMKSEQQFLKDLPSALRREVFKDE